MKRLWRGACCFGRFLFVLTFFTAVWAANKSFKTTMKTGWHFVKHGA